MIGGRVPVRITLRVVAVRTESGIDFTFLEHVGGMIEQASALSLPLSVTGSSSLGHSPLRGRSHRTIHHLVLGV